MEALNNTYTSTGKALEADSFFLEKGLEKKGTPEKIGVDYFTGGMAMPGRSFNLGSYRYGLNGMEMDNEVKGTGNHYTTFWRQYDPRLVRWMSTEPKPVAWESLYAAFRNNPIYYADPNGDWVKGAGLWNNLTKSDNRINAENRATELGGDAMAFKNEGGGWNVGYTTGETVDFGNGEVNLKTVNIENFDKQSTWRQASNWWDNSELFFRVQGKMDIGPQAGIDFKFGNVRANADLTLMNITLLGGSIEQSGSDYSPYEYEFDYLGEDGYLDIEQQTGLSIPGIVGAQYEHTFEGGVNGGYRNEKHTTTINATVIEGQLQQNAASRHSNVEGRISIGGRISLGLGIEGSASFGVKEK